MEEKLSQIWSLKPWNAAKKTKMKTKTFNDNQKSHPRKQIDHTIISWNGMYTNTIHNRQQNPLPHSFFLFLSMGEDKWKQIIEQTQDNSYSNISQ